MRINITTAGGVKGLRHPNRRPELSFRHPELVEGSLTLLANLRLAKLRLGMHVITRKRLNEFAEKHPDAQSALEHWYRIMKTRRFANFVQLREAFPSADQVDNKTVFNIGGNKYRLIAAIHYNRARIYVRAILTHPEYDKGTWKHS